MENFIDFSVLIVFVSTFFFVSITPGMCMTLAMSLGISIGLKKTFFMMIGELIGVGIVASASVIGVAGIMLHHPTFFLIFKYLGGAYLAYLGINMWRNKGKVAFGNCLNNTKISRKSLIFQGFITAIANPKGWAFFIALFPPFINQTKPLLPQISILLIIILLLYCRIVLRTKIDFTCIICNENDS